MLTFYRRLEKRHFHPYLAFLQKTRIKCQKPSIMFRAMFTSGANGTESSWEPAASAT